jgi:hypothetical protein
LRERILGSKFFVLISVNIAHPISYILGLLYTFIDGTYSLVYASYCSRFTLFRFGRTLFLQSSSNQISQSDLIYVIFRNLPHFTLISFVFVKFFYLFIQQLKCHCCQQSTNLNKNHQVSLVSSTLSIDLLTPDYQTKPEFNYTQGKIISTDFNTKVPAANVGIYHRFICISYYFQHILEITRK